MSSFPTLSKPNLPVMTAQSTTTIIFDQAAEELYYREWIIPVSHKYNETSAANAAGPSTDTIGQNAYLGRFAAAKPK